MSNFYLLNEDSYFNSDMINITMIFLAGNHTTLPIYVELNLRKLDTLRMEGMTPAAIVSLTFAIQLTYYM